MTTDAQFKRSDYALPIPELDGRQADKLLASFAGPVTLDRTSWDDVMLIDGLQIGEEIDLRMRARVTKKGFLDPTQRDLLRFGATLKVLWIEAT